MIRDRLIRGAASSSSEAGPRVGPTVPAAGNQGGVAPVVTGEPSDDTDAAVTLRLTAAGALGVSQWIWAGEDGAWRGSHSDLYLWGHHPPASTSSQGAAVAYSRVYRRVVVASVDSSGTPVLKITYAAANARPTKSGDWSAASFTPVHGINTNAHSVAICEAADGAMLLVVRRIAQGTDANLVAEGDFDLYRSTDGALTWALFCPGIGGQVGIQQTNLDAKFTPRLAASGDWVRLCLVGEAGDILTLVSSDGGATWRQLTSLIASTDIEDDLSASQQNDVQPFTICAVDDSTGAFVLIANPAASGNGNKIGVWYASRSDDWDEQSGLVTATVLSTPRAYCSWRDPYYVWVLIYTGAATGANDAWTAIRAPRDGVLSAWEVYYDFATLAGAARLTPIQVTACWCEDRAAVCGYLQDMEESAPVTRMVARPWLCWVGGWSARPWAQDFDVVGNAEVLHWSAVHGEPANGTTSSANTEWTGTLSGSGTHAWSSGMYVECSAASGSGSVASFTRYILTTETDNPPQWDPTDAPATQPETLIWASEWTFAVGNTSPASAGVTSNAIQWQVPSTGGGGYGWTVTCMLGTNSLVLYNGSSPIATLSGLDLTTAEDDLFHRGRLVVSPAASPSSPIGILQLRRDDGDQWEETGPFAIGVATSVGVTRHRFEFGLLGSPLVVTPILSRWRDVRCSDLQFLPNYPWMGRGNSAAATNLPGALTASRTRGMAAGATDTDPTRLRVAWGGVGGAAGDSWTHTVQHDYPAAAVAVDSPRVAWRSVAGATAGTRVVLDACGAGATADDGSRWVHSAIALYGLESQRVGVFYADDAAGTVNLSVAGTASSVQYTGVRVSGVSGRHVSLSHPTGTWRDGDLTGRFLRLTSTALSTAVGRIYRVERHIHDGTLDRVELDRDGQFGFDAISVGDTAAVFSDRVWLSYGSTATPRRYLILNFGAVGDNNWAGRWAVGSVVPGVERTFLPRLSWSHTDELEPFVTVQRTRGGQSWAYEDAPPERVWTGRWQGSTEGEHAAFRDHLRHLSRMGEEPCALLLSVEHTQDEDRAVLLTRYEGAVDLDRQFYSRAAGSTSQAYAGGDMSLRFRTIE